jgi:hypothetical protein
MKELTDTFVNDLYQSSDVPKPYRDVSGKRIKRHINAFFDEREGNKKQTASTATLYPLLGSSLSVLNRTLKSFPRVVKTSN